jgi:two-component system LytT family sensor kinase
MLNQDQLAALLLKIAVSTSLASIVMRFGPMQRMLLRDDRTLRERLHLAFIFALLFGASAEFRILSHDKYQAVDLALEGSVIAGILGGYVSGLITGLCASIPDMFNGKWMSMALFSAAGIIGALIHDLAPRKEDVWSFSPFVDLNLWRLFRQLLRLKRDLIQRRLLELAAFNLACNFLVVLVEGLRWGVRGMFQVHGTFFLFEYPPEDYWVFFYCAAATLFAVSLPIRVWSSYRAERQLETQQARLTEARLAALTNQINPHFLFNTLNSIATLIRINPDNARNMIYRLSKILRRLLRKTENYSPLREEIAFIDDYLAIEMVRFGEKLKFQKDIETATLSRLVPSMILQPIIENSIRHGLASKVDGGTVRLRTWLEGTRLNISIEDDGVGIDEEKLGALFESGIGVSNVNERLRVLFGAGYRMAVDSTPGGGTKTRIEIPELEDVADTALAAAVFRG